MSSSFNINAHEMLFIGDISNAFLESDAVEKLSASFCENISQAVTAASKKQYDFIAVVLSEISANLISSLEILSQASHSSKIILLVQMYEEPIALRYIEHKYGGKNLIDDYVICPLLVEQFYESILPVTPKKDIDEQIHVTVDSKTAMRIKQLEKLATEDELTGLKNRRYILEFARQIIERAKKQDGKVTILIFDIDDFKHYNDIYGHAAGDEILRQASALMNRCCRRHDVVGRIGGDEFTVVFWDDPKKKISETQSERRSAAAEHPKEPVFIAERFRKELESAEFHLLGPGGKGVLTISGGLASFPRDGSSTAELFKRADHALLEAKRSGKNTIYLVGQPEKT